MRLAVVEWIDSCADTGWQGKHVLEESTPSKCVSVGMVVETDSCIKVFQSKSDTGNVDNIMTIPRCSVKRIRYLKIK